MELKTCKIGFLILFFIKGITIYAQVDYKISYLSFNTASKELAPAFYQNSIVFCSDRRNNIVLTYTDNDNNPVTNLYKATIKGAGKFDNPKLMSRDLTTFLFEGPSSFSNNGSVIYFTRSIDASAGILNKERTDTTFGIFTSKFVNGKWTDAEEFRFNSLSYNTGYPSVTEDGSRMFFCSDAPGGYGGFDIYVCDLVNGQWTEPENLGTNINTAENEVFPFYQGVDRLYFSSRGYTEKKDMNIYLALFKEGLWQTPSKLGEPFNTSFNDYGLIFNSSSDTGYFVSDRKGSPDIYGVYMSPPTFINCQMQEENDYCFVFYESNNNEIDTSTFTYEWDLGDGTKIKALEAEHCFKTPGTYNVNLNIIDKLTQDVLVSQASYAFKVEKIEQPYISCADTVKVDNKITINGRESFITDFNIENYYWDFGDGNIATGIEPKHIFKKTGTYNIRLGVTDINYNLPASDKKSCVIKKIVVLK